MQGRIYASLQIEGKRAEHREEMLFNNKVCQHRATPFPVVGPHVDGGEVHGRGQVVDGEVLTGLRAPGARIGVLAVGSRSPEPLLRCVSLIERECLLLMYVCLP